MKVKKLARLMQKYINNKEFMTEIYKYSDSVRAVNSYLAATLEYLICTNGQKIRIPFFNIYTNEIFRIGNETLQKRIVDEGVMTHSFNGYNQQEVKRHGLGSESTRDPKIDECFKLLESALNTSSPYTKNQTNTANEIYMCSPGIKSFYYASAQSPERLYLGILQQSRDDSLPVVLGQTKEEYMLRVAYKKIEECGAENKTELYAAARYLVHAFCSKRPVIAIFPAQSKKYELKVSHAANKYEAKPLKELIDENVKEPIDYFSNYGDLEEPNNLGNLVSYGSKIPAKELSLVEVPDRYEMLQQIAYAHGKKMGDEIDYFTGKPYQRKEKKVEPKIAEQKTSENYQYQQNSMQQSENEPQM